MLTKITILLLVIALLIQSYCIRIMFDMIVELKEGYNLIDGRISEINDRSQANAVRCNNNAKSIDYLLRWRRNNDL